MDAYDDPNATSDLATYRSDYGLPPCGGCFEKVNQNGQPSPLPAKAGSVMGSAGWDAEESLDTDMVSAICPLCNILLVEANSVSPADMGTANNTAVAMGAKFVSNSWGGFETSSDPANSSLYFNHPGVAVTVAAGGLPYIVTWPASSPYVTSVGGTRLTRTPAANSRGWTETAWALTGSGCSAREQKPAWQTDTGCPKRTNNDVAAVADMQTGVATYDTYSQGGWVEQGGTSAASAIIASVFALRTPVAGTYPSSYIYQHPSSLFDVTSGSNGTCSPAYLCTAEIGYDGPTGWGTPDGTAAFAPPDASRLPTQDPNSAIEGIRWPCRSQPHPTTDTPSPTRPPASRRAWASPPPA